MSYVRLWNALDCVPGLEWCERGEHGSGMRELLDSWKDGTTELGGGSSDRGLKLVYINKSFSTSVCLRDSSLKTDYLITPAYHCSI